MTDSIFDKFKEQLIKLDPVSFVEKYLTLDGKPFRLNGNGYKPFADIYRYIGFKALEPNAKPVIITKGRQVGGTTMACALEMYFMGSGLFGNENNAPIRIIHAFPQLEMAAAYSKTKLNPMISGAVASTDIDKKGKPKSFMQSLLDTTTSTNDSLHFKQFQGGNHIWIESTGLDADRIRGRQLCLETEIPTPDRGFIKLKDLQEGDKLFDEKGNVCTVTKLHPINLTPEAYRITFDDGTTIDACAEHLWSTKTKTERRLKKDASVRNTKEILETLKVYGESNHSIELCEPVKYPERQLDLDPYVLGLWLGNGDRYGRIKTADPEVLAKFPHRVVKSTIGRKNTFGVSKSCGYRVIGLTTALRKLNLVYTPCKTKRKHGFVFYKKYIPEQYMHSSFEQRLALLQGLMDSDGCCYKDGRCEFVQVESRKELFDQVVELICSLGIKCRVSKKESWRYDVRYQDRHTALFCTTLPVFRLEKKLKNQLKKLTMSGLRYIRSIEPIPSKPMRCITVDSPSHLYLITKSFIPTHNTSDVIFFDEVQDTTNVALTNTVKTLTTSKYGPPGSGVQVYFGTPKRKGSDFHKMWMASSQQYYYLGCKQCKKHFPLYTPGSNEWENIWIREFTVRCTHCNTLQDKREAAERGKWVSTLDPNDEKCKFIGFHINQFYMPHFSRERIDQEKPGVHPINTERAYQNEVLGEFFQGDSSPITEEEIVSICGDLDRKMSQSISAENVIVTLGIDYGARADLEQLANPEKFKNVGQSFTSAVVLVAEGSRLSVEYALKFNRNDMETKKQLIEQIVRQYNVQLTIGDIGFSQDFSTMMHMSMGDRYLVSRAHNKITTKVKYNTEIIPKEIGFERDFYLAEMFELMKKGNVRFPIKDYEKILWLIKHCASMEIKPSISAYGDPTIHYVKGGTPNDGMMALLNAYLAYKFIITNGFTNNNTLFHNGAPKKNNLAITGYISRRI